MKSKFLLAILVGAVSAPHAIAAPMARIDAFPTDLTGSPIDKISKGEDFLLNVVVQDIRENTTDYSGILAAYLNIAFEPQLIEIANNSPPAWGPHFTNEVLTGDRTSPGLIELIGAYYDTAVAPGNNPQLLVQLPATAIAEGTAGMDPLFHSNGDFHVVAVFGYDAPLAESEIQFVGSTLRIVPEPSALALLAFGAGTLAVLRRRTPAPRGLEFRRQTSAPARRQTFSLSGGVSGK